MRKYHILVLTNEHTHKNSQKLGAPVVLSFFIPRLGTYKKQYPEAQSLSEPRGQVIRRNGTIKGRKRQKFEVETLTIF